MTTLSHDKLISQFDNEHMDILNRDKWEVRSLDKNQGSSFDAQIGHKPKSFMCYNCGKLRHIVLELNNPFDSEAINYLNPLMQKSFPHSDNCTNGRKGNVIFCQNYSCLQNYRDPHQGNDSRNDNGGVNGNNDYGNQPNNTKL